MTGRPERGGGVILRPVSFAPPRKRRTWFSGAVMASDRASD